MRRAPAGPGPGAALAGYAMLMLGFFVAAVPAQGWRVVPGLWLTELFVIALPGLLWLRAAGRLDAGALALRWPGWRWMALAAITGALNQPIVSLLTWAAQQALPQGVVDDFQAKNHALDAFFSAQPWAMLAAVALSAPLGEEIFFRGFALPALARSMRPLAAALVSALLFSLMHLDAVGALGLFEIGLWLALLRWGSRSIFPAMLGHAVNNGIAGLWFLIGLQVSGRGAPAWAVKLGLDDPDGPPPAWTLALGALLLLAFCAWCGRVFRDLPEAVSSPGTAGAERPAPGDGTAREPLQLSRAAILWGIWAAAMGAGLARWVFLLRVK